MPIPSKMQSDFVLCFQLFIYRPLLMDFLNAQQYNIICINGGVRYDIYRVIHT